MIAIPDLSSLRWARILIVLSLFASFSILDDGGGQFSDSSTSSAAGNKNATAGSSSLPTSTDANGDEHFSLCGRRLYLRDMPLVPSSSTADIKYGVTRWRRDLERAVVLDPRLNHVHGRTGNQIRGFFHAFDYARDRGGPLVMHSTGFPMDTTLKKLYLGLEREDLEEMGLLLYDSVEEKYQKTMYSLGTRWARDYVSTSKDYDQFDVIQHRHYIIQRLYRMTAREMARNPDSAGAKEMCASMHAFFGEDGNGVSDESLKKIGITKPITSRYVIIHSRSFEGKQFLEEAHRHYGVDPRASLDYPPDLINSILAPLGMANDTTIFMITDGQNSDAAKRLSSDPIIGPRFQVVPKLVSTMTGDILLAILSDVFVGNPASSFSQYITMVRYALGFGRSYLHVRRDAVSGEWESFCREENCFYYLHDLEAQTHQPGAPKTI